MSKNNLIKTSLDIKGDLNFDGSIFQNGVEFSPGGGITWSTPVNSTISPDTGSTPIYDLGTTSNPFKDLFIGLNSATIKSYNNIPIFHAANYGTFIGRQAGREILDSSALPNNNTLLGYGAGYALTGSGGDNTFVGDSIGQVETTGNDNVYIGSAVGQYTNLSTNNIAMGSNTLRGYSPFNPSFDQYFRSNNNIALGNNIMIDSSNYISSNILIGHNIFTRVGSANGNVIISNGGFNNASVSNNNTVLGWGAGHHSEGSGNVFIGRAAGEDEKGSNKLIIANDDSSGLIYGDFTTGRVDISTSLWVNGEQVTGGDGIKWSDPVDASIIPNANGVYDLGDEDNAFKYAWISDGIYTSSINSPIALWDRSPESISFGLRAGESLTYVAGYNGWYNTLIGNGAGKEMTTGNANTLIGTFSGTGLIAGGGNTYLGYNAGNNEATSSSNVFIGYGAGNNTPGSDKLVITNSATDVLIYGEFDNDLVKINDKLEVNRTYVVAKNLGYGDIAGTQFYSKDGAAPANLEYFTTGVYNSDNTALEYYYIGTNPFLDDGAKFWKDSSIVFTRNNVDRLIIADDGVVVKGITYIGDKDTDGSWRYMISGDNLVYQRRESGVWETKETILATPIQT